MGWTVYILKCDDGRHYTGCTKNLNERYKRHNAGEVPATKGRLPVELLVYISFPDKYLAYAFEKYLKSGSGRAFTKRHFFRHNKLIEAIHSGLTSLHESDE